MSTTAPAKDPNIFKLQGRLSFPSLFKPKKGPEETSKASFSLVLIMDKKANAKEIALCKEKIAFVAKDKFKGKTPGKTFLRDGAEKPDLDGYGEDVMFISARSDTRPGVVDRNLTRLEETDGKPYAGCYVICTVRAWAQDNKFGKRINLALRNVQFVKDGEPFGDKVAAPEDELDALPEEDEAVV